MLVKKAFLTVFLLISFRQTLIAGDTKLQAGQVLDGTLTAGKADSYVLTLKPGDLVETDVVRHGTKLLITIYDPSGNKARGFGFDGPGRKVSFVADNAGNYRLEVALNGKAKDGLYTITLTKIIELADRLSTPPSAERYESPRIRALRAAVGTGQPSAVDRFWEEVKTKGAPLIEPKEGDDKNMLVTFLWRGTAVTKNVMVIWFPFTFQRPDSYRMTRLGGTDVWYRTIPVDKRERFTYTLGPDAPPLSSDPLDENWSLLTDAAQPDPLNPNHWLVFPGNPDVSQHQGVSAVEMPGALAQPWIAQRKGVPAGKIEKHQFASGLLNNEREIAVYTPSGYSRDANPYDLAVIFDEKDYLAHNSTLTTFDNLIADKRIPPMVIILIDNPSADARNRELPCNRKFADFLASELLPWAHRLYDFTADPRRTIVGGVSYGGLAAACAGLWHPETFGNVLSQSGSFWWTPPKSSNPSDFDLEAEPNWVAKQFIASPKLALRFYMDAGTEEFDPRGNGVGILPTSRHLRDVLLAKGYEVHYQEFNGGHDFLSWRGTFADGLIALMGKAAESQQQSTAKR